VPESEGGDAASPDDDDDDEEDDDGGAGALWGRVPGLKVPPKPAAWNADRMIVRDFRAQVNK